MDLKGEFGLDSQICWGHTRIEDEEGSGYGVGSMGYVLLIAQGSEWEWYKKIYVVNKVNMVKSHCVSTLNMETMHGDGQIAMIHCPIQCCIFEQILHSTIYPLQPVPSAWVSLCGNKCSHTVPQSPPRPTLLQSGRDDDKQNHNPQSKACMSFHRRHVY